MSERRRYGDGMGSSATTTENSDIERRTLAVAVAWVGFSFDVPAVAKGKKSTSPP
jgi:hypothetical protein